MSDKNELFTLRMRKATRRIHSVSDALINAKFAISLRDESVWSGGLFVFYHIFAFLEELTNKLNMPELNELFVNKSLFRKKAFEEDLEHYIGKDWCSLPKSAALENYLEHLQYLEKENPILLIAYVYHLYLGLLSGGQILAKKRKMFDNCNNSQYRDRVTDFSDIDIARVKDEFRAAMNRIAENLTESEKQALIDESHQVFLMNNLIVNSVEGQSRVLYNLLFKVSAVLVVCASVFMMYRMQK